MNSLEDPSLPPNELHLKVGVPIMLLRTLDASNGLRSGARFRVKKIGTEVLECVALGVVNDQERQTHLIPRITFKSTFSDVPFQRRQFPVRVAFAMTMHKSQGQTIKQWWNTTTDCQCTNRNVRNCSMLEFVLDPQMFTHRQLYVNLPRSMYYLSLIKRLATQSWGRQCVSGVTSMHGLQICVPQ